METKVNGFVPYSSGSSSAVSTNGNGYVDGDALHDIGDEPSIEELRRELPNVEDGQIPLREVLQRIVQAIYAELTEMADKLLFFPHSLHVYIISWGGLGGRQVLGCTFQRVCFNTLCCVDGLLVGHCCRQRARRRHLDSLAVTNA